MANSQEVAAMLNKSLGCAQNELASAEIALLETTARAAAAREESERLASAVAALSGAVAVNISLPGVDADSKPATGGSTPSRDTIQKLTPEEFDKLRRQKQRAREKQALSDNPLAHLKCTGCGRHGTLVDSMITAPSGAIVRMMVCSGCGNQVML